MTRTSCIIVMGLSLLVGAGLIGTFDLPATDVFLEATRPDFQKIPIGVFGFQNGGGPEWLGGRIEEVLRADLKRSLVFNLVDLPSVGVKAREVSSADKAVFKQAADNGVSVLVWGKAGGKNGDKENDLLMDGYVYDSGSDEIVGGKRYVGSSSVVRLMAHRFADEDQQREHDREREEAGQAEPRCLNVGLGLRQQLAQRRRARRQAEAEEIQRRQRHHR